MPKVFLFNQMKTKSHDFAAIPRHQNQAFQFRFKSDGKIYRSKGGGGGAGF